MGFWRMLLFYILLVIALLLIIFALISMYKADKDNDKKEDK